MRIEEFISAVSNSNASKDDNAFETFRKSVPLGLDESGNLVCASRPGVVTVLKNLCVTGKYRTEFICRVLITLSCLYEKGEANFILVSPNTRYAEILGLENIDATVPYVRSLSDLELVKKTIQDILLMRRNGAGYPRLFLVLDGLEDLTDANRNNDLAEYRAFFDMLMRRSDAEVICGADLIRSIFEGCPGGFIGIGNCLVTALEPGKADVTYVGTDAFLSQPMTISYPDEPSLTASVALLNALGKSSGNA